jgi:gluconolactonase
VDVDNSVIHALDAAGVVSTYRSDTNYTNGMGLDPEGRLVAAEMGGGNGGRLVRHNHDGSVDVLASEDLMGRRLHTVDDVVVHRNGTIFFTDADFPHGPYNVNVLTVTLVRLPVYILRPGAAGFELMLGPSVRGPNGIELSPDQKTLYLSAYFEDQVLKYAVAEDGSLTPQGSLATRLNKADSMCLDAAGNIYVGIETGLQVLRPDGTRVKKLNIASADGTTNCTFGGPDGKTLFVTSYEALWKVENMPIPGLDWVHSREVACP